jgi:hypothetical protein
VPDGLSLPEAWARREARLTALAEAKATIEAAAQERLAHEQADYEAKLKARGQKVQATGKPPRGRPPAPPTGGVRATDPVNLTEEDSRLRAVSGGDFEQGYHAQAAVDVESLWVVAARVRQASHDKQPLAPRWERLGALPEAQGLRPGAARRQGVLPYRERGGLLRGTAHALDCIGPRGVLGGGLGALCRTRGPAPDASPLQALAHRLKTPAGRALYAVRPWTVEPEHVMGFRQFSLRGLDQA